MSAFYQTKYVFYNFIVLNQHFISVFIQVHWDKSWTVSVSPVYWEWNLIGCLKNDLRKLINVASRTKILLFSLKQA